MRRSGFRVLNEFVVVWGLGLPRVSIVVPFFG